MDELDKKYETYTSEELVKEGYDYCYGEGVEKNLELAYQLLKRADEMGNFKGTSGLGYLYGEVGYPEKDDVKAVEYIKKAAEGGDAWSQSILAERYATGNGVEKNTEKMLQYMESAAEGGDSWAQRNMGDFCRDGKLIEKDVKKAETWYKLAMEQGDKRAMWNLAGMYWVERACFPENQMEKAVKIYEELNTASAKYNLYKIYRNGYGVEIDNDKAIQALRESAEIGDDRAQHLLAEEYRMGVIVEKNLKEAETWYKAAIAQGNRGAMHDLAVLYIVDKAIPNADLSYAAELLKKLADDGDGEAAYNLAVCYSKGEGVELDFKKSAEYYLKSALTGDHFGEYYTGLCYYYGRGVEQNYIAAREFLEKAAEGGVAEAYSTLGIIYKRGNGLDYDDRKAYEYFKKAAEMGGKTGMLNYAMELRDGTFERKNLDLAEQYARKALEAGVPEAEGFLEEIKQERNAEMYGNQNEEESKPVGFFQKLFGKRG